MKIFVVLLFVFQSYFFAQHSNFPQYSTDSLQIRLNNLKVTLLDQEKRIQQLEIEKSYFDYLLQNNTSFYTLIITSIIFVLSLISFPYFIRKTRQINLALSLFNEQVKKTDKITEIQDEDKKDLYFLYANINDLLSTLNMDDRYSEYLRSYYFSVRAIKYLLLAEEHDSIETKLEDASESLKKAECETQSMEKLDESQISEIRDVLNNLSKSDINCVKEMAQKLIFLFEKNIASIGK